MIYEKLLNEATENNIYVIENACFKSKSDGLINKDVIGLSKNIPTYTKKACVLAEELGHYYTSVGNILDPKDVQNRKQELRARVWAYNKLIGLGGIIRAYQHGCETLYEMTEYLDVTEDFLQEALVYYRSKYGIYTCFDNYVVYFEPTIGVFELIN